MRKNRIQMMVFQSLIISIIILNSVAVQKLEGDEIEIFFSLVAKAPTFGGIRADYLNFLRQHLERIGINVDIIVQCWPSFVGELIAFRDFDIACFGLAGTKSFIDPDFTGVYNENGSLNAWGYHTSMDWDEELGTGKNEWYMKQGRLMVPSQSQERIQHYWDWEQYLMDEILPLQPLFAKKRYDFNWNELEGYDISEGILQSWGKMNWNGVHTGQLSTNEIVIRESYKWSDLNPITNNDANSAFVIDFLIDSLVWIDSDMSVNPHLAKSIEMINDTHIRINLREGIKWQEDSEALFPNEYLDVKDVFFTFYCWKEISNQQNLYHWIEDLEIIDQYTLDVFIDGDPKTPQNEPYAPIYNSINLKILPEHYLNQTQLVDGVTPDKNHTSWSTFSDNGFGTCLFSLADYQEGIETTLEIWNDCWWLNSSITNDPDLNWLERFGDFTGGLNQLRVKIITDHEMAQAEFEVGYLDIIDFSSYPRPSVAFLQNTDYEYQSEIMKNLELFAYNMRTVRPIIGSRTPAPGDESITKGLAIRKAISYAINRAEINNVLHQDLHKIVDHPIYDKLGIWCNPDIIKYDYDLNEAKRYMKIAGYDIDYTPTIGLHVEIIAILSISSLVYVLLRKRKKSKENFDYNSHFYP